MGRTILPLPLHRETSFRIVHTLIKLQRCHENENNSYETANNVSFVTPHPTRPLSPFRPTCTMFIFQKLWYDTTSDVFYLEDVNQDFYCPGGVTVCQDYLFSSLHGGIVVEKYYAVISEEITQYF